MPAYNYQECFVPFILDGSKSHTIRALRKGRGRHARPGETLYLYTGMRTKQCRKIGEAVCVAVKRILIIPEYIFIAPSEFCDKTTFDEGDGALLPEEMEEFAWKDGFRPEGSSLINPDGAWELMQRWFQQTHELPFEGVVIYWEDFLPAK